ncbi:hypothetical protein [Paenibacillus alginolyticus]|uniref:Uncharacterized protein n=2 Tax=Paenibacillus alginolyticus TaxID=59839 RepID=A0ABT4GMH1_9BACL|nr:hypothetical protein [Paenibacillus alginolyticus]MCY9697399.1 hypothetical protein [Paenibacillus alginolyticus]
MKQKSPYPGGVFDTNPTARGVFAHPIPAVFCRYGTNISLQDIEIEWNGARNIHWKQALYGQYIEKLSLLQFHGAPAKEDGTAIELKDVIQLSVEQCKAQPGTHTFMSLEHVDAQSMFVVGNDFAQAEIAIHFTDGTNPEFFAAANRMPK